MRRCYGGHVSILSCSADEWILVDKIVYAQNERMSHFDAVNYCESEMEGQLWGDIDEPDINLHVHNFFLIFHHSFSS